MALEDYQKDEFCFAYLFVVLLIQEEVTYLQISTLDSKEDYFILASDCIRVTTVTIIFEGVLLASLIEEAAIIFLIVVVKLAWPKNYFSKATYNSHQETFHLQLTFERDCHHLRLVTLSISVSFRMESRINLDEKLEMHQYRQVQLSNCPSNILFYAYLFIDKILLQLFILSLELLTRKPFCKVFHIQTHCKSNLNVFSFEHFLNFSINFEILYFSIEYIA